jgi:hypothetical protein
MDPNPRKIKRFVNIFRLKATTAETFGAFNESVNPNRLGQWVFLSMDWPELVKVTINHPAILNHLIRSSKKLTTAKKPRGIVDPDKSLEQRIVSWRKDTDLMRFLRSWDKDFNIETIEAFRSL